MALKILSVLPFLVLLLCVGFYAGRRRIAVVGILDGPGAFGAALYVGAVALPALLVTISVLASALVSVVLIPLVIAARDRWTPDVAPLSS